MKNVTKAAVITLVAGGHRRWCRRRCRLRRQRCGAPGRDRRLPGIPSGNVVQAPVHRPGQRSSATRVDVIGLLNPAFGNTAITIADPRGGPPADRAHPWAPVPGRPLPSRRPRSSTYGVVRRDLRPPRRPLHRPQHLRPRRDLRRAHRPPCPPVTAATRDTSAPTRCASSNTRTARGGQPGASTSRPRSARARYAASAASRHRPEPATSSRASASVASRSASASSRSASPSDGHVGRRRLPHRQAVPDHLDVQVARPGPPAHLADEPECRPRPPRTASPASSARALNSARPAQPQRMPRHRAVPPAARSRPARAAGPAPA